MISVLLPVYNGGKYIKEAIDSILSQTYPHFELIIIDDGSKDNSSDIIKQFDDTRIRFYTQKNIGLATTLNRAIELSKGKYLARQDQDDISTPSRLEKQVSFLDENPDYGLVGTWARIMEDNILTKRIHNHSIYDESLKLDLLFNNPFVHSSVMIRKSIFEKISPYTTDPKRQPPEDYELWSRISRVSKVANIPEILHIYREVPTSMSRDGISPFLNRVYNISTENIDIMTNSRYRLKHIQNISALSLGYFEKMREKPNLFVMLNILRAVSRKLRPNSPDAISEYKTRLDYRKKNLIANYIRFTNSKFLKFILVFYKVLERKLK